MGLAQLRKIDHIIAEKRRVAQTYTRYLQDIPGLQLPVELDWALNVYWMYAVVVKPKFGLSRDQLAEALWADGIETRTFFCPMNQQPCLQSLPGFREISCPVADRLWETGLYLPSSWNLTEETIKQIAESIRRAYERREKSTV
jgi:perosamine synthetase